MSAISFLHLLSNMTRMSVSSATTVACYSSFALFRAVSTIVKLASPGQIVTWWPCSWSTSTNSFRIALCCCFWLETLIAYNELHSAIEIQPLWNLVCFFFDIPHLSYQTYTHQRQWNILFHTSCQDNKCTASKFQLMVQECSSKPSVRVPLHLPHKLPLLITWWSSLLMHLLNQTCLPSTSSHLWKENLVLVWGHTRRKQKDCTLHWSSQLLKKYSFIDLDCAVSNLFWNLYSRWHPGKILDIFASGDKYFAGCDPIQRLLDFCSCCHNFITVDCIIFSCCNTSCYAAQPWIIQEWIKLMQ